MGSDKEKEDNVKKQKLKSKAGRKRRIRSMKLTKDTKQCLKNEIVDIEDAKTAESIDDKHNSPKEILDIDVQIRTKLLRNGQRPNKQYLLNDTAAARHANEVLDVDAALSEKKASSTALDSIFCCIVNFEQAFPLLNSNLNSVLISPLKSL